MQKGGPISLSLTRSTYLARIIVPRVFFPSDTESRLLTNILEKLNVLTTRVISIVFEKTSIPVVLELDLSFLLWLHITKRKISRYMNYH